MLASSLTLGGRVFDVDRHDSRRDRLYRAAWNGQTFVVAIGVALMLGVLGGLYPAWRASRLQPVEALRYE